MGKNKSDYDRLETVKGFKVSKMSIRAFAIKKGMSRETLRSWVNAYDNVDGSFVRLNKVLDSLDDGALLPNDDVTLNLLKPEHILKKSRHFSRFDHSVVVIELGTLKITTSLEQAQHHEYPVNFLIFVTAHGYQCVNENIFIRYQNCVLGGFVVWMC